MLMSNIFLKKEKKKLCFESCENDGSLEVQRINRAGVEAAYE